ncbi:FecR domain-containing protein [Cupriavidus sp. USMAA2-4]|uniref:FecR domain-containing protein n=1 Tax=Cupriavidus sp. USMAA2-4 TaxID=876364 RepID=UPI000ACA6A1D|nr:FecR domain-containing protein [Cupriavidus sp. USMAA2-4]
MLLRALSPRPPDRNRFHQILASPPAAMSADTAPKPAASWPAAPEPPIDEAVTLRATEWMVQLMAAAGDARSEAECEAQCRCWRAAHADHERAWQHLCAVCAALRGLPAPVAHAVLARPARRTGAPGGPGATGGRRGALALLLAGGAVAIGWQFERAGGWPGLRADYRAGVGQRRRIALADGTVVDLNTDSAIALRYGPAERVVVLLAGEIAVATAPDPDRAGAARPFLVETGHGRLRALGTRFTVRLLPRHGEVGVQQGAVEIQPAGGGPTRTLQAGERTTFTRAGAAPPTPASPTDTAWTAGMLAVHDMRLERFLAELSRYRHGRLGCSADVADLRLSGIFPLADTEAVLETLPHLLPVAVHRFTRYWVDVRRRPD